MLIVLDPGHGGKDSGAVGPSGLKEKDVVLAITLKAKQILEKYGVSVVCTRETDVFVERMERVKMANEMGAAYFISIHCNAYVDPDANGTETYVYKKVGESYALATNIQNELLKEAQLKNRGIKEAGFTVLIATNMPAVLTEFAFITHPKEEELLKTEVFKEKLAKALAEGILHFLGIDTTKPPHWGQPAINKLLELGLITENKDPESAVTWAEFAVVLLRALNIW